MYHVTLIFHFFVICFIFPHICGTGMIRPRPFRHRTIRRRTLFRIVISYPYVSSPKKSQPTERHQPIDWLGIKPNLT